MCDVEFDQRKAKWFIKCEYGPDRELQPYFEPEERTGYIGEKKVQRNTWRTMYAVIHAFQWAKLPELEEEVSMEV